MDFKRLLASAPRDHDPGPERSLLTVWGERLVDGVARDEGAVRAEHPHPQFARENFTVLNGWWDYAIVPGDSDAPPEEFDGRILVPFSPESLLSGVGRQLQSDEVLWYRRRVPVPTVRDGARCLLHFEAVDWACACWVNGREVVTHEGGYLPFAFDVTAAIGADTEAGGGEDAEPAMEIVLRVIDPSDAGSQPRGKQKLARGGIWPSTGGTR